MATDTPSSNTLHASLAVILCATPSTASTYHHIPLTRCSALPRHLYCSSDAKQAQADHDCIGQTQHRLRVSLSLAQRH
jgi:hypothetical protein